MPFLGNDVLLLAAELVTNSIWDGLSLLLLDRKSSHRGLPTKILTNLVLRRLIFCHLEYQVLNSMPPAKSDLLQNTLDLLILKVVALEPTHGYAIAQRILQMSNEALQIQQGSLYPALYRLEERGFLQAQWRESENGRMAKFYSLTRKGARQLETERENWQRTVAAISQVLIAGE